MGGGNMLPGGAGAAGGRGPSCSSATPRPSSSTTTSSTNLEVHHSLPILSRGLYRPPSSECAGLAEACASNEKLDFSGGTGHQVEKKSNFNYGFGPTPSRMEVEKAMADLQRYMHGETRSDFGWLQPMVSPSDPSMLQCPGYRRLHDAFGMLQKDPSMQSTVASISCDKAVWEAIMNNRTVQDLQGSIAAAKEAKTESSSDEANIVSLIMKWIIGFTKSKLVDLIEKFGELVAEIFQPAAKEKPISELTDLVEEKIRSSLLLSVAILLIVVVTRIQGT